MKVGIVVFPGSNCDHDAQVWSQSLFGRPTEMLWYADRGLKGSDFVLLPGGFSYGDYLRCGAMAARAPIMEDVVAHARSGGPVLGICNGFQVLCELRLLPGALLRNRTLTFLCQDVFLRCETVNSPFTATVGKGSLLRVPIAHGDGNYFADPGTLERLEKEDRVAFRYTSPKGELDDGWNPNGSMNAMAGILHGERNVMGMMPHPERASEALLGSTDGAAIFKSLLSSIEKGN
jgi:phosphoribosylformylglycinamidine synthase subunit PurQ / glutaminase